MIGLVFGATRIVTHKQETTANDKEALLIYEFMSAYKAVRDVAPLGDLTINVSVECSLEELGVDRSVIGERTSYRIVNTDNFGGDYPNESFVGEEYESMASAQTVADEMNGPMNRISLRYFKVVKMPYELQPGFEP